MPPSQVWACRELPGPSPKPGPPWACNGSTCSSSTAHGNRMVLAYLTQYAPCAPQVRRAGQARDVDTLFHSRLTKLESSMDEAKMEVQQAVADALEGGCAWAPRVLGPVFCTLHPAPSSARGCWLCAVWGGAVLLL